MLLLGVVGEAVVWTRSVLDIGVEEVLLPSAIDGTLVGDTAADIVLMFGMIAVLDVKLDVDIIAEVAVKSEVDEDVTVKAQVKGWLSWSLKMLKFPLLLLSSVSYRPLGCDESTIASSKWQNKTVKSELNA